MRANELLLCSAPGNLSWRVSDRIEQREGLLRTRIAMNTTMTAIREIAAVIVKAWRMRYGTVRKPIRGTHQRTPRRIRCIFHKCLICFDFGNLRRNDYHSSSELNSPLLLFPTTLRYQAEIKKETGEKSGKLRRSRGRK